MDFLMAITMTVGDTSLPEVKAPTLRGDVDVEVTDVSTTGDMTLSTTFTGTAQIQFDSLSPTSEMNVNTKTTMSIDMGGNVQHMNMAMSMKVAVTPGVVKERHDHAPQ
jgi:hypothetical protein